MPVEELRTPASTPELTDTPAVLSEYDHLVSSEAQAAYGARIEQDRPLLELERLATEAARRTLDRQWGTLGTIPHIDFAPSLDGGEDDLRKQQAFYYERDIRWNNGSGMLFNRHDPAVAGLLGGLLGGAETAEQPFIDSRNFMGMADTAQRAVVIEARDEPLEFPITAVVSAAGFESWESSRGEGNLTRDGRSSSARIRDYASRETPPPPVDEATALIFQDGRVALMSSNAHRAAAAKLRGQSTIYIKELVVYRAKAEQPREMSSDGLAAPTTSNTVSAPAVQPEQPDPVGQPITTHQANRWQRYVDGIRYHHTHRLH